MSSYIPLDYKNTRVRRKRYTYPYKKVNPEEIIENYCKIVKEVSLEYVENNLNKDLCNVNNNNFYYEVKPNVKNKRR